MTWISVQDVSKVKDSYLGKHKIKTVNRYQEIGSIQTSIEIKNTEQT